jgi:hypothetical protein
MLMFNIPGSNLSRKIAYTPYAVMILLCASKQILGWNLDGLARYFSDNTIDLYDEVLSSNLEGVSGAHEVFFVVHLFPCRKILG